jgi:hypothetical protein
MGAADAATSRVKGVARKANRVATGRTPPDHGGRAAPKASEPRAAALTNLTGKGAGAVQGAVGAADSTLRGTTGAVNSTVEGTVGTAVSTLRTGVGAGFSLVVHKALLLLQILKRIALQAIEALRRQAIEPLRRQAIEALRRLARRLREYGGVEAGDSAAP